MRSHSKALFAVAALLALLVLAPLAQAAPKGVIATFGEPGGEGGQFGSPAGVAINQSTGDIYVLDAGSQRIAQFTEDGNFIRAWGKDVVQAGGPGDVATPPILVDERQTARLFGEFDLGCFCPGPATGGAFTLSFDGQTTDPIPFDASAALVKAELEALGNIDTVDVTKGAGPRQEWTIEFTGSHSGTNVSTITANASALQPPGTTAFVQGEQDGSTTSDGPAEICTVASTCQRGLSGSGEGEFSLASDSQLAIDQSDGSLYVADTHNHRIQKFSETSVFLDEFGTNGSGQGEFSSPKGVAVDPASSDLYVADTDNNRVQRFEADATFVDELGIAGSGDGEFFSPNRVAADSTGRLYVLDSGNARVQRFDNTGAFEQVFAPGSFNAPSELAVDPATDNILIAGLNPDFSVTGILEFDSAGNLIEIHAPNVGITPAGLAARASNSRIYVSDPPNDRIMVLDLVTPPSVTIEPVTDITSSSATFNGTVNPEGPPNASYRFEYSEDGSNWIPLPTNEVPLGEGTADIPVSQSASGLDPNTEFKVRLRSNKDFNAASVTSTEVTFTTNPVLPIVRALPAGPVSDTSAWLGAEVNPRKAPTTFYVEYTTDPGFANATSFPASKDAPLGSTGKELVLANQLVKGLQPATTYHFRIVATSAGGTTSGESGTFTTLAGAAPVQGLPDGRVWEKVSPAEKAGAHVSPKISGIGTGPLAFQTGTASHGNAVAFMSAGKFGGDGGPPNSSYLAKRGPDGWVTEGINPPLKPVGGISNTNNYQGFARDLSWGVVKTSAALNPGDPEQSQKFNLYLRDFETNTYRLINDAATSGNSESNFRFLSASEDGRTVFFAFDDDGPRQGAEFKLFKRSGNGEVEPAGILPDGTEAAANVGNGIPSVASAHGVNPVSADGSRYYFTVEEGPEGKSFGWETPLYVREGDTTTLVSGSERSGDDPTQGRAAHFFGASKDGSVAFFASRHDLSEDSNVNLECGLPGGDVGSRCFHLYRWDATAPEGERLTDLTTADPLGAEVMGMTGMSEDGSSIYFVAGGDLSGSGERDPQLYLWREGEGIRLVADAADRVLWGGLLGGASEYRRARVTPDGRFLAFESRARLTAYDTAGKNQVYLYDSLAEKLSCASCGSFLTRSKGSAWLLGVLDSSSEREAAFSPSIEDLPTNLSPDGRLVFDSRDPLVPEDTNGVLDVYEWEEGRLHLLSSGTAATYSSFFGASEDLDDVFFTTEQKLVRSDNDTLRDLYDARVGGIAEPDITPPCVADECQGTPTPPPTFQTPSSASFKGAGNASKAKQRCAKGKVSRKGRCVKRKMRKAQQKKSKRTQSNRRAGR